MKLFFLFASFFLSGAALGETGGIPARVTGSNVNLRTGPSRRAEIVGQLPRGTEVLVVLTDGEWSSIVPPEGTAGWISRSYLEDGVVTGSRVNLRAGPSVAYASLMMLGEGAEVAVIEERDGWARIKLPDTARLWMSSRYLSADPEPVFPRPAPAEPPVEVARDPVSPPVAEPRRAEEPAAPVEVSGPAGPEVRPLPTKPEPPDRPPAPVPPAPGPRSYTGFIRELEQPFSLAGREYEYELAESRHAERAVAFLTGETVDLSAYRHRKIRLWAETIEARPGHPALLEVRGAGFLW